MARKLGQGPERPVDLNLGRALVTARAAPCPGAAWHLTLMTQNMPTLMTFKKPYSRLRRFATRAKPPRVPAILAHFSCSLTSVCWMAEVSSCGRLATYGGGPLPVQVPRLRKQSCSWTWPRTAQRTARTSAHCPAPGSLWASSASWAPSAAWMQTSGLQSCESSSHRPAFGQAAR